MELQLSQHPQADASKESARTTLRPSSNPAERNELSQQISQPSKTSIKGNKALIGAQILQEAQQWQRRSVEATYNPRNNFRANNSLMHTDLCCLNRGGPSIATVVKDIFTIDANMYLDWTSGIRLQSPTMAHTRMQPKTPIQAGAPRIWRFDGLCWQCKRRLALKSIVNSIGYALAHLFGVKA